MPHTVNKSLNDPMKRCNSYSGKDSAIPGKLEVTPLEKVFLVMRGLCSQEQPFLDAGLLPLITIYTTTHPVVNQTKH